MNFYVFFSVFVEVFFLTIWFFRQIFFHSKNPFFSIVRWQISLPLLLQQKPFICLSNSLIRHIFREKWSKKKMNGDIFLFQRDFSLGFFSFFYFGCLVSRVKNGCPVELALGSTCFLEKSFIVRKGVFLPRVETEEMAQKIIERHGGGKKLKILELGSGSGVIGISLLSQLNVFSMCCADISAKAIHLTERNAKNILSNEKKNSLHLFRGDVFSSSFQKWLAKEHFKGGFDDFFDIVVSNPPYVAEKEHHFVDATTKKHDPHQALYAGADGLDFYRNIFSLLPSWLKKGGVFYGEIGFQQSRPATLLADKILKESFLKNNLNNYDLQWHIKIEKDLFDKKRFLIINFF